MSKRLLIVEDDETLAKLLAFRLIAEGMEVTTRPDAVMGIKAVQEWKPDVVLLDLKIPAGGGLLVLQNLQRSVLSKHIPVLIITGSDDPELKRQLLKCGITTYLQKPFDPKDLVTAIQKLLPA